MSYDEKKLTNDDFRKLFMTPRHPGDRTVTHDSSFATPAAPGDSTVRGDRTSSIRKHSHADKEKGDQRRKKKHFYAKIKKEEDDQMAELAKKYRDRAKERRDGGDPTQHKDELITAQGAYRAVAPDFRGNFDAAERRKQMIQESKFLGGDMEHTHLVKGLDYALLQKVRSELETLGEGGELPEDIEEDTQADKKKDAAGTSQNPQETDASGFRTKLAKNIYRTVFKNVAPERNELFAQGRMAYVMDLEDEYADSDIPTTVIRSKADVPNAQGQATLTTNDIVINKLAQILSYLRSGSKSSRKHKRVKEAKSAIKVEKDTHGKPEDDSIYGDIGAYEPVLTKSKSSRDRERDRDRGRDRDRDRERDNKDSRSSSKRQPYFEKSAADEDGEVVLKNPKTAVESKKRDRDAWSEDDPKKQGDQTFGSVLKKDEKSLSRAQKLLSRMNAVPEGYAECYPGFDEMHDAIDDSDDETDYSKMDPGKKKGSVGRWDFDSVEEYSEYMSNKEALPKAAFQFGVKMNDGRKTRKNAKTEKNEKAQLDRQWQQVQAIMNKRKGGGGGGDEPEAKSAKT